MIARHLGKVGCALTLAAGLAVAGCGGGSEPSGPATLTPANAPIYLEAVVRPQGDQQAALDSALSKLLNTEAPGGFVVARLNQVLAQRQLSYAEDVQPWLGEKAGLFVENFKLDADAAAVIEATDTAAAKSAIDKAAAADPTPERDSSYKGVGYKLDANGNAVGIVGDFVVAGTEPAFRDTVDVEQGKAALAADEDFSSELDSASGDPAFTLFADVPQILTGLQQAVRITPEQRALLAGLLGGAAQAPVLTTIAAAPDRLTLDTSLGVLDPEARLAGGESDLLRSLPGDSWAAFGVGDLGATARALISRLGPTPEAALRGFEAGFSDRTGFGLETDLLSWMGDVAVFASGNGIFDFAAGAVLDTTNTDASLNAIDKVESLLRSSTDARVGPLNVQGGGEGFTIQPTGAPAPFNVVQRGDRIVAAYGGDVAIAQAFSPEQSLGDSDLFAHATDPLGGDYAVSGYLDFDPLRSLVQVGGGAATASPAYARVQPYLDHLDYFALGSRQGDDRDLFRAVLGLK